MIQYIALKNQIWSIVTSFIYISINYVFLKSIIFQFILFFKGFTRVDLKKKSISNYQKLNVMAICF